MRVAWSDDAGAIAQVQVRAWERDLAATLGGAGLPAAAEVAEVWAAALARPEDARNRVLVALERNRVVGFAVTTPAADPDCDPVRDGEIVELVVQPGETGRGHGSRLLQAAADTLVADRFARAVTWVGSADDARRGFLHDAGWEPDQAHRELALGDGEPGAADGPEGPDGPGSPRVLRQVRLHTALQ